jgi:uncharacterized protein (TIGR03792 family)
MARLSYPLILLVSRLRIWLTAVQQLLQAVTPKQLLPLALAGLVAIGLGLAAPVAAASTAAPDGTPSDYGVVVVEHLRVKVPAEALDDWIAAERGSWEPWLERQPGFLDRQLLWDPEREEGTLLIHWRNREAWKAIPAAEIEQVQQRFEALARSTRGGADANPFPLVFEGQLLPQ